MFEVLATNGINIEMISTSSIKDKLRHPRSSRANSGKRFA